MRLRFINKEQQQLGTVSNAFGQVLIKRRLRNPSRRLAGQMDENATQDLGHLLSELNWARTVANDNLAAEMGEFRNWLVEMEKEKKDDFFYKSRSEDACH